jgi:hypothetical protein
MQARRSLQPAAALVERKRVATVAMVPRTLCEGQELSGTMDNPLVATSAVAVVGAGVPD